MTNFYNIMAPLGRFLMAFIFIFAGLSKIFSYEGTQGYMEAMGVPGMLLPITILWEVIFGVAIVIGFKTRFSALALGGFSIVTAMLFHSNMGDQMQSILFMKNMAMAGGLLFLVAQGPGPYSIDKWLQNRG